VAEPWRNRALAPVYAVAITFVLVSAARGALGEPAPATDVQVCVQLPPGSKIEGAEVDPATRLSCRRYPTGEQPVTILPIADPTQKSTQKPTEKPTQKPVQKHEPADEGSPAVPPRQPAGGN